MAIKQWLKNGGIAVALTVGAIEGNDLLYETSQEKEVKFATAIMADAPGRAKIQAEEIEFRKVGEEVKSKRTETGQVFKGPMVTAVDDSGREYTARQFQARVFSGQKYFYDPDGDSLMALDLTVRQVEQPNVVERMIEGVKELIGIEPQPVTHDTYVKAGPYAATWFAEKPYDYTIHTMTGNERVQFTTLHDTTGMSVETIPTSTGMKQTWVLRDDKAATVLQWKVDSSAPMIHDGGRVLAGKFTITEPIAWDADSTNVPVAVSVSGDTLTYTVFDAGKAYPITIDPTVEATVALNTALSGRISRMINIASARDWVRNNPNGNETHQGGIAVGCEATAYYTRILRGILRFDTSVLGAGAIINNAHLHIRCSGSNFGGGSNFFLTLVKMNNGTSAAIFDTTLYNDFDGWAIDSEYVTINLADSISTVGFSSAGDTTSFHLRSIGLSQIKASGTTQFMMLSSHDIDDVSWGTYEYTILDNTESTYLFVHYTLGLNPPTYFTLSSPTVSSIAATHTVNHSANVDSQTVIDSGGTWKAKFSSTTATTVTVTGLTPNYQCIFRSKVDSLGYAATSNLDTLYTLAAAPTANFSEYYPDSTKIAIGITENGNPATTTYAIRDSTNQKWIDASGNATVTKTWRTAAQWATTATINGQNASIKHLVGVVAKNGDGIETAYSWQELTLGNAKYVEISAIDHYTTRYKHAAYLTSRNDTTWANIYATADNDTIGQRLAAGDSTVLRASYSFAIPVMDDALACSLKVAGVSDQSATDFRLFAGAGAVLPNSIQSNLWKTTDNTARRHFAFSGFDTGVFSAANMLQAWSTSSYGASIKVPFTLSGLTNVYMVRGDTLRLTVTSSADSALTRANGYIVTNTPKLGLWYVYTDKVPSNLIVTAIDKDSLMVTWTDNSYSETGFALVDAYTGLRIGGDDSTSTNATSKRMGGLLPNKVYNIKVKVLGGKIADDVSTSQDSARTWAAVPDPPTVTVLATLTHRKIVIDTAGLYNPGTTLYALQDSITGKYVRPYAGALDSMVSGTYDSSWVWQTFSQWGGANGDTIYFPAGSRSAFRIYSKNSQ